MEDTSYALQRNRACFINYLLDDLVVVINLFVVRNSGIPGDLALLGTILTRFFLHYIGTNAHMPKIIDEVWGMDDAASCSLGGLRRDLQFVSRQLTTHTKVAINHQFIWQNRDRRVISDEAISRLSTPIKHITAINKSPRAIIFVREKVGSVDEKNAIIMDSLRSNATMPSTAPFEEMAIQWIWNSLLYGEHATNEMGKENGLFAAFRPGFESHSISSNICAVNLLDFFSLTNIRAVESFQKKNLTNTFGMNIL